MQEITYWLISITTDSTRVSFVSEKVISQGQDIVWDPQEPDSLLKAIDTSLSSQNVDSTSNCAFVVPPNWILQDGKMLPEILKSLKYICEKLKLHPLGQISYDEAFVESYNNDDQFPASYILIFFSHHHYQISLVYLDEIIFRQNEQYYQDFEVSNLEQILFKIDSSSALPPKIIVTGAYTHEIVEDIKNYNWLANKNVETFLHLPDVMAVDLLSLDQIFSDTIKKQISPNTSNTSPPIVDVEPIIAPVVELDAQSIGFTIDDSPVEVVPQLEVVPPQTFKKPQKNFTFPKIDLNYYWLLPFTLLPFLPVLPLFFSRVDLTVYLSPIDFVENFDITLDPKSNVSQKTFELNVGSSIATTGKKEVGQKAKGEITIFNKSDRVISLNKGLLLTDSSGKSFETTNNILLPASTYNLDTGVINMGQIKVNVLATVIGPEYNLASNQTLNPKDNSNLMAKSTSTFAGGSKDEIAVVTQSDKAKIVEISKQLLKEQAKKEINSQKNPQNTILDSTMVFENQKTVYSREVGEESEMLSLNLTSKVSFLYLDISQKQSLVSSLFQKKPSLALLDKNSAVVNINYVPNKLTMTGKANPIINIDALKSQLVGKKESQLKSILNILPRYYQHDLTNSLWFINLLKILPVKPNLLDIVIKN